MCTAVTYQTQDHYFGRNLDLEFSYQETVTITPRNFLFQFRKSRLMETHYAMIGMAYMQDGYPLYYDAANEAGVSMAGLNFPGCALYGGYKEKQENIAPFEFIPWVLGQCADIGQVKKLLKQTNLIEESFSEVLHVTPLHWIISDREESIVVEPVKEGLQVYDAPVGVLTNSPPFPMQMMYLRNFLNLTREEPENRFSKEVPLETYSRGMGAIGLPGDMSSSSRFVRAAFVKWNAVSKDSEEESVSQFFHILNAVEQPRGCVHLGKEAYEITVYSSCCNMDRGIYYYTTYENRQITAVDMHRENLNGKVLISYPLIRKQQIRGENT